MAALDAKSMAPVWWTVLLILLVEISVRVVLPFNLSRVLIAETIAFVFAAAFLNSFVRRSPELSRRRKGAVTLLSLSLVLGGLRTGLWFARVPVQWANVTILMLALGLFSYWWRRRRRGNAMAD